MDDHVLLWMALGVVIGAIVGVGLAVISLHDMDSGEYPSPGRESRTAFVRRLLRLGWRKGAVRMLRRVGLPGDAPPQISVARRRLAPQ